MPKRKPKLELKPEAREAFWRAWIKRLNLELGAMLAETIDVKPSEDEDICLAVEAAIALEQETAS